MKNNIVILAAFFVIALAVILSCNKDYSNINTQTYTSLDAALKELAVKSKTVTINASTGGSFRGNSGSRYVFPPNAFKNSAGAIVTGDVQVEVKEFLNKADMLFSNVLPVTSTDALISGGETSVNATQGGQPLTLAAGTNFQVNMPQHGTPVEGMKIFNGHRDPVTGAVTWKLNPDTTAANISYNSDTTVLNTDSLDLCNADRFLESPDYQTFTVSFSTSDGAKINMSTAPSNTIHVYALYDQYNGVWPMQHINIDTVTEYHVPNIPVHFAVMGLINGKFYGGILGATPATGTNYHVTIKPTTPAAFQAQVKAL